MHAARGVAGRTSVDFRQMRSCFAKEGKLQIRLEDKADELFAGELNEGAANEGMFQFDSTILRSLARKALPRERLTGPTQFVLRLLEHWRLQKSSAVVLLGFGPADATHVADVLEGFENFRGRDVQDRIAHLYRIRETLDSLFRDLEAENQWLREPHSLLEGKSPLSLILGSSMEDLLMAREYVDSAAGR